MIIEIEYRTFKQYTFKNDLEKEEIEKLFKNKEFTPDSIVGINKDSNSEDDFYPISATLYEDGKEKHKIIY